MAEECSGCRARDLIDDLMVRLDMLERDLAVMAREERYKGRVLRLRDWIEDIRDIVVELKRVAGHCACRG